MIFKIGSSCAKFILQKKKRTRDYRIAIAKDTPLSGQRIEVILADAINFYGIDVFMTGTLPITGLSHMVKKLELDMGIMISASNSRPADNGIKFIGKEGAKLNLKEEQWMEQIIMGSFIHASNGSLYRQRGDVVYYENALRHYREFLESASCGLRLDGYAIITDCAWGATSGVGNRLLEDLGARVSPLHNMPNVEGVKEGGALNPSLLKAMVVEEKADIGLAFDADGDRVVLVDEKGAILDGDYILAIIGLHLLARGKLSNNALVATVMSNGGLIDTIQNAGGYVHIVEVGDKYVFRALMDEKLNFGGEPSGHIINLDHAPVPDGLLTALEVLKVMKETGKPLSELAAQLRKLPQVLVNVKVKYRRPFESNPELQEAIIKSYLRIRNTGRLFVRYSGTENVVRIMAEGKDQRLIQEVAYGLADIFTREIGVKESESYV
jgi:phosphoglucosamine mutase